MRETAVESHPFRKVREKDGAPGSLAWTTCQPVIDVDYRY